MSSGSELADGEPLTPGIASTDFRRVLGHFLTGVAVVAAIDDGRPVGMAVGSFFSVSLDPPLVGFCPAKTSTTWPAIKRAGRFCVSVLAADQYGVCGQFSASGGDKFAGVGWTESTGGCPKLDDVLAWIDCEIYAIHDGGDHEICIGLVSALGEDRRWPPLAFFRGGNQIA
jgi:3-hydroxy-9,10-secoandrosta-1,3,5(10)-triene-9,17-dione monooxygenase reductase component